MARHFARHEGIQMDRIDIDHIITQTEVRSQMDLSVIKVDTEYRAVCKQ